MERTECKTKEDLFRYIDSQWSEDDRRRIMEADVDSMHFGFGLWVRNHLIYPDDVPAVHEFVERFNGIAIFEEDSVSETICEEYQRYLKRTWN